MGRPHRINPPDGWHHVMNRGVDRSPIYFDDVDRVEFGRLLGLVSLRFGVETHGYCLMGNHYHLLLRSPGGKLSEAMHLLGSLFVRFVNDRIGRDGPLFRGRFHSKSITNVAYLANVVRYIHLNPLDIAGIATPSDYRWSSHRTYLGFRRTPEWLSTAYFMNWFGNDVSAFDAFVTKPVLGASIAPAIGPTELIDACETIVHQRSDSRLQARRGEQRAVALTLADEVPELRAATHELLGLDGGSLRTARSRAKTWHTSSTGRELVRATRLLLAA